MPKSFEQLRAELLGQAIPKAAPGELPRTRGRKDLLKEFGEDLKQPLTKDDALSMLIPGKAALVGAGSALKGIGGLYQRAEGAASGAARAYQEGGPGFAPPVNKMFERAKQNLLGERQDEYGDVLKRAGASESVSQIGGLAVAGLTDPTRIPVKIGQALTKNASRIAKLTGRETLKGSMSVLQGQPDNVIKFMLDDNFRAASEKYLKSGASIQPARDIAAQTKRYVYRPASKAYARVVETLGDSPVAGADDLATKLESLLTSSVAPDLELERVRKAATRISKLSEEGTVGLKDVLTIQRNLRKAAAKSVVDADAVRVIGDHLEGQFPELVRANALWRRWANTLRAQDASIGKIEKLAGKASPKQSKRLLTYFTDENQTVARNLDDIQRVLKESSGGKAKDIITNAARVAAAKNFRKTAPGFKGLMIGAVAGAGATPVLGPAQGAQVGALIGGLSLPASSPKVASGLARHGYETAARLEALMKTPLGRTAKTLFEKPAEAVIGQGISRQLTGRNQ